MSSETDVRFMRRALALARRGGLATRPNPRVGAVFVRDGRIIAEGYHRRAGGPHAEIDALAGVDGRAPGATAYVTLEPCSHTGRTPPCTKALLQAGVARVVVGVRDPNPLVDGRGLAALRRAGVTVDVGCLEDECRALNRAFFVWIRDRRPLVTLKAAASWDGFIADGRPRARVAPVWLTGPAAREAAHALRSAHHAILVGAGTVRADDPQLTDRRPLAPSQPRRVQRRGVVQPRRVVQPRGVVQPRRVVIDGRLAISPSAAVLGHAGENGGMALVFGAASPAAEGRARALRAAGADVVLLDGGSDGRLDVAAVLAELAKREIQSVLVEGGAATHAAFIEAGLVDRVALFLAPRLLGAGIPIARDGQGRSVADSLRLGPPTIRRLGDDLLLEADVLGR